MSVATVMIGPADHGRPITWAELSNAEVQNGHRYELIDGRVYVAPAPNPNHQRVWKWIHQLLDAYSETCPNEINYVIPQCAVFVEDRSDETAPEPDVAAYCDYPLDRDEVEWSEVSPVLVIEIVSPGDPDKDLVRNVELYEQVPSIREYWIFDPRDGLTNTTLRVYRRRGRKWQKPLDFDPGETYSTKLLPGFCLRIDPLA